MFTYTETPVPVQVDGIIQVQTSTYRLHDLVAITPGDDEFSLEIHLRGEDGCYEHVFETEAQRDEAQFQANKFWHDAFVRASGIK